MTRHLIAIAAAAIALQGCATQAPPAQVVGEDVDGIAKTCTASPVDLSKSPTANATITLTNDGWCAVRAVETDGKPFQLALVRARPEHGRVLIQPVSGRTRIEYTADNRYVGPDRFTIVLRSKTPNTPDSTLQVAVTVAMGESVAPVPPPASAPAPATRARAPARPAPARTR